MMGGKLITEFDTKIEKPRVGEIISTLYNEDYLHYEVSFIQYMFDKDKKFQHILITAIKK